MIRLKELLKELADEEYNKRHKPIKLSDGYMLWDLDAAQFHMIKLCKDKRLVDDCLPEYGVRDVLTYKKSLIEILDHKSTKGLRLKTVEEVCDHFRKVEQIAILSENKEYRSFLRSVLRSTMKVSIWYLLISEDKRKFGLVTYRIFKAIYTLYSSNISLELYTTRYKTWFMVYVIVMNAFLRRLNNRTSGRLVQVRNMIEMLDYMKATDFIESKDDLYNAIFSRGSSVFQNDLIEEYKYLIMPIWTEYTEYREYPNWY